MPKQKSLELQEVDPALKKIKVSSTGRNAIMKALMMRHQDLFATMNAEIAAAAQKFIDANYLAILPTPEHQAAAELMMNVGLVESSTTFRPMSNVSNSWHMEEKAGLHHWARLHERLFGKTLSPVKYPLLSSVTVKRHPREVFHRQFHEIKGSAEFETAVEKILANRFSKALDTMLMIEAALKSARTVYDIATTIPELVELATQCCAVTPENKLPAVVDAKQVRSYLKSIEPLVALKPAESADAAQVAAVAMGAA